MDLGERDVEALDLAEVHGLLFRPIVELLLLKERTSLKPH